MYLPVIIIAKIFQSIKHYNLYTLLFKMKKNKSQEFIQRIYFMFALKLNAKNII